MGRHRQILNIIAAIRQSHSCMVDVFTKGSCINLFEILHLIYPESEAYFNIDHVITKIGGKYYDITGCVSGKGYERFERFYDKRRTSRAFSHMKKAEYRCLAK